MGSSALTVVRPTHEEVRVLRVVLEAAEGRWRLELELGCVGVVDVPNVRLHVGADADALVLRVWRVCVWCGSVCVWECVCVGVCGVCGCGVCGVQVCGVRVCGVRMCVCVAFVCVCVAFVCVRRLCVCVAFVCTWNCMMANEQASLRPASGCHEIFVTDRFCS